MKEYKILTQGDKIKDIRTRLNFRQEDLAGEEITRNLISIIENNKANLTQQVAKVLVININQLCKERNIEFSITEKYLLEDVTSQAKKVADEYIKEVEELTEIQALDQLAYEIDVFLKTYPTEEKKPQLYLQVGLKFRKLHQYSKAIPYFIKAYESSNDLKLTTRILLVLTSSHIYLSKYDEAINYIKTLMALDNTPLTQFRSKYNLALCYKKLNMHNEAFDILGGMFEQHKDIIESDINNTISLKMLMGSCLNEMKCFNKAISTYKELLKICTNEKDTICILSNLADVYRSVNDTKNLQLTCKKILDKIDSNVDLSNYESYVYVELSKNLRYIDPSSEIGLSLLYKALNKYKQGLCTLYIEDVEVVLTEILNIFIINSQEQKIEELKNDMFELIEKDLFPKTSKTVLRFIKYYNLKGKVDEIANMVDYLAV